MQAFRDCLEQRMEHGAMTNGPLRMPKEAWGSELQDKLAAKTGRRVGFGIGGGGGGGGGAASGAGKRGWNMLKSVTMKNQKAQGSKLRDVVSSAVKKAHESGNPFGPSTPAPVAASAGNPFGAPAPAPSGNPFGTPAPAAPAAVSAGNPFGTPAPAPSGNPFGAPKAKETPEPVVHSLASFGL